MWQNAKTVLRTHAKNPAQMAWAIIQGLNNNNWIRIRPNSPDGVMNVHIILSVALANNRQVDVLVVNNEITEATLR